MIRPALLSLVLLLAMVAEAGACSCVARTPEERMASADAAFIGKVTAVRSEEAQGSNPTMVRRVRVYTVTVEKAYKGDVGSTAEVRGEDPSAGAFTSCSETFEVGDELGGFFEGAPSEWFIFSCNRATREDLEAGATGFPSPSGSGEAVALLTGPFGDDSPFAALGADGRVIAYARGASESNVAFVSVCPLGGYLVESTYGAVRTRRIADLAVVRTIRARIGAVRCLDRNGTSVIAQRGNRLVRIRDGRVRAVADRMLRIEPGQRVSLAEDRRERVLRVDSRTGAARRLAVRGVAGDLSVSPDGTRLAVIARRRLMTFSTSGRRLATARTSGARETIAWIGRRAVALPETRRGAAAVGGNLWWARGGRLYAARSARGAAALLAPAPNVDSPRVVALPARVPVSDPARFNPSASAGSPPRARRAQAGADGPRGDCPKA